MSSPLPDPVHTPDRVSTTEARWRRASRLLAICLLALWTGLALVILVAYRPGGPWDALVAVAAFAPVCIAAIAVVRPPMPDPEGRDLWRSRAAIAWVGLIAVLGGG